MISCSAILLSALFFLISSSENTAEYIRQFETQYSSAKTLQATFLERYSENGRTVRTEAGIAYFLRPGKMRWEYESPEQDVFLVDGKTTWFYVPADHTVTRMPVKDSNDWRTPLALLTDHMKVSRVCSRVTLAKDQSPENPNDVMLYCLLRGNKVNKAKDQTGTADTEAETSANQEAVYFEIAKDSGNLVRVLVQDPGNVRMEFKFANWQFNPVLKESLFHFSPPVGTAIVNGVLPMEEGKEKP